LEVFEIIINISNIKQHLPPSTHNHHRLTNIH